MAIDHAAVALAGILPNRRDHLLFALQHLEPEHFRGDVERNIYMMLDRYYNLANDIMPLKTLEDILERRGTEISKSLLYTETYSKYASQDVADHEFRYAIDALKEMRADALTGEAITKAMEVLERGIEVKGADLKGHEDARQYLYSALAHIDKLGNAESVPEGDIRLETDDMLQDYADRKSGIMTAGVRTGIPYFDEVTSGMSNGELILIPAYTAEGKTQLCTQISWDVVVNQGLNVFFATSETVRRQVMRRLLARHTRLPQFGLPGGVNVKDIKNGTLTTAHEEVFRDALDDFHHNPTYGKCYIAQVPRGATLGYVEARVNRQAANFDVNLVVMDYLALLKPDGRHQSEREGFNEILRDTKVMATSHADGRGVPVISPWAMRQSEWKIATRETGFYTLANLADTSEAEKSADMIWSLLRMPDVMNEVRVQFLKNRDGEIPPMGYLETDYRNAYLGPKSTAEDLSLLGGL